MAIRIECLVLLFAIILAAVNCEREKCAKCIPKDMCDMYGDKTKVEQERWVEEHPCEVNDDSNDGPVFGFAPTAKGDYVCCPYSNIWGVETPNSKKQDKNENERNDNENERNDNDSGYDHDQLAKSQNSNRNYDENDDDSYDKQRNWWDGNRRYPSQSGFGNQFVRNPSRNQPIMQGSNPYNPVQNQYNRPQVPSYNQNVPQENNNEFGRQNRFNTNVQPQQNTPNQKCSISILPPSPQSGCCGLDVAGERTFDAQRNYNARPRQPNYWYPSQRYPVRRYAREVDENVEAPSLDNRIAGGKETDLYQFPWTVLLKTTFDYGDRKATFNCGGSLISSRYVLTAAHCVNEANARLSNVDIYLAEFDKRTFPVDCVNSPEGRKCIQNLLTQSESVVVHPYYDDTKLQNDIALIRLRQNVPYTEYMRPICLPPVNVDNSDFSNLRLAVAGWGRNGSVPSEVKQSTVVNLVPQRQCLSSYPSLSEKHVCAAGRSGEDTCKGDSGGPLMMLYQGQYYVSGVVSGKRRDAPCGTAVPSLYTNVYQYIDWIQQNISN